MATRIDLAARLIDKLGLLTSDEMVSTDKLNRSINNGIERMATEFTWPWLQAMTTVNVLAGTSTYNLPSRCTQVIAAGLDSAEDELTSVNLREILKTTSNLGDPRKFTIIGSQIRLLPTPSVNDTLTLIYVTADTYLSDDSKVVLTPDWYLDILVTYAALDRAVPLKDQELLNSLEMMRKQWLESISESVLRTTKPARISLREDFEA